MDLEVKHLKLMVSLAQTQNMTQAAENLRLTQSALSHQLKQAEETVGAQLFLRRNKRLVLTPAGKQFLEVSQETLGRLQVGMKSIQDAASLECRFLRISTECYTSYSWLPGVLKKYSEDFPCVKVEFSPTPENAPVRDLLKRKVDIAVMYTDVKNPDLITEPLFSDELMIIMSSDNPLSKKRFIAPKDLQDQSVIIYNVPDEESTLLTDFLKPADVTPGRVTRMNYTEGIIELVKAGLGFGMLAPWAVSSQLENGTIVARPMGSKGFHRTWKIVYNKKDADVLHIKEFIKLIRGALG